MGGGVKESLLEPGEFDPFAGGAIERVVATSEAQREVWLADRLGEQASLAFNESVSLRLCGELDEEALRFALVALIARHQALRSTIGPDGTELVVSAEIKVELPLVDLRRHAQSDREAALAKALAAEVETPFDLLRGPLLRCALLHLSDAEHLLLMTAHHVICDGWSWAVIAQDLGVLYAERLGEAPAPDAPDQYADYVEWEAIEARSPAMREHERYWLGRFAGGSLPVLDLPTDRPRKPVRTFASRRIDHHIDASLCTDVRKLGAKAGASMFATLFTGFAATLHRLTGHDDVVIGVPTAGQSASGLTTLVGHCVNLLPVRTPIDSAQPFHAFLGQSSSLLLDAFEHQTLTYGTLLQQLPVQRDPSRLPLVSVMFNVDQATGDIEDFPRLNVELTANPRHFENFELFVNAVPDAGGYRLECQYNSDLFDVVSVRRWLLGFETLLRSAVRDALVPVGRLDWTPASERDALNELQAVPTPRMPGDLMHSAFVRQARATPERCALRHGASTLNYRALDERSNSLANALRARGISRGARVGLCLNRSAEMVVAMLAVMKAGATYVPLDPGFPAARLAYYAEDAQLALLLTESSVAAPPSAWCADAAQRVLVLDRETAWQSESAAAPVAGLLDADPEDAAYVIYTSGSTGKPKGVAVPHRSVANFLASMAVEPGIAADDRLAAVTTLSFDIAVLELMLPLTVGAETIVVPRETAMDGNALKKLLTDTGATQMQATPGMWRMLLDTDWQGGAAFKALIGGESCPPDLAHALLARCGELWNMYGPTETTVWSTVWKVDLERVAQVGMSIGRPIANTQVWVLDDALEPCPIGVPGELCIGGAGVALGYLDRPELTAERFIADRFGDTASGLVYRTGDRGRWRNDGLLEHLGRLDFQVKVRGYRIELGEIEAGCNDFVGVTQSVVMAREDQPGDVRLVAYVVPAAGRTIDENALKNHLRDRLPEYMIPQHVVSLDAIPFLPNGKVDRKALPQPVARAGGDTVQRVAPRNPLERQIAEAMEAVLNLPGLGVHDDFFALGGHSLLAARLTSRLNRDLDLALSMRTLFEAPSVEKLAIAIDRARGTNTPRRAPIPHAAGRRSAPLTAMQERVRFVEELHPGRVVYNTPSAHRLTGPMDVAKFERAFNLMIERQPALRTSIRREGDGWVQQIAERLEVKLPLEDLRVIPAETREAELMRRMQAIVDTPVDIHAGPLFRVALYRLADDQHAFLFMPHHIIWDGWSFDLLYNEMSGLYGALVAGQEPALPPLPVTYGDFAQWHAQWLQGDEYAEQMRYWKQRFSNAPVPKAPRPEKPRGASMSGEGASEWVRLDATLTESLREVARSADATLNMLTMAVYAAMMAGIVGGESIVVGMPVRGREQAEIEPVMGFFNNMLPLPISVQRDASAVDFIRALKGQLLDAFAHQGVPFERLAVEPEVAARVQRAGLYQALFSFQDARERPRDWGGLRQQSILIFQKGATEDLGLWLMEVPSGLEGGFTYNADLYTPQTASAFRARFLEMVQRLAAKPSISMAELMADAGSESAARLRHIAPAEDEASESAAARPALPAAQRLNDTEYAVAEVWASLLQLDAGTIRVEDRFFALGANSLLAMQLVERIAQRFGRTLRLNDLVSDPNVREFARLLGEPLPSPSNVAALASTASPRDTTRDTAALLRPGGTKAPVFFVHDGEGETLLYRNVALRLSPEHPVYGLQPLSDAQHPMLHTRIADMARHHVEQMRRIQANGPYLLAGLCAGGVIAHEMARQLQEQGERVGLVGLIDAAEVNVARRSGEVTKKRFARFLTAFNGDGRTHFFGGLVKAAKKAGNLVAYEISSRWTRRRIAQRVRLLREHVDRGVAPPASTRGLTVAEIYEFALMEGPSDSKIEGDVVLFRATTPAATQEDEPYLERFADPLLGWQPRVRGTVHAVDLPGGHFSMLQEPHAQVLAEQMQHHIDRALADHALADHTLANSAAGGS